MDFYQTVMGRRFYEGTMPQIARALTMIGTELKKSNEQEIVITQELPGISVKDFQAALAKGMKSGINMDALIKDLQKFEIEDVFRMALVDISKVICDLPLDQILNECKARHDSAFSIEDLVDIQNIFHDFKEALEGYLSSIKANESKGDPKPKCFNPNDDPYPLCKGNLIFEYGCGTCNLYEHMQEGDHNGKG